MCVNNWSKDYPLQIERREKERVPGSFDDTYFGLVCRVMRRSDEAQQESDTHQIAA